MATKAKASTPKKKANASTPEIAPPLDLSSPKERAVLDVLALAMSADEVVTGQEMELAVKQLQALLQLPRADEVLTAELKNLLIESVTAIQAQGREPVLDRALQQIETEGERRMLFALATSVSCVDGTVHPAEALFLSQLRRGLGLSDAEVIQGVAGVAAVMARRA